MAGLRIHAPLRRLKVGNTMPLFAVGIASEAETPHAFGSANPALTFAWTINSQQVDEGVSLMSRAYAGLVPIGNVIAKFVSIIRLRHPNLKLGEK